MYHDDCLEQTHEHIKEALKRLPPHLAEERNFRIARAMHHDMKKIYLPKEEWISYEEVRIL